MMKTSLAVAALLGATEAVELGKVHQNIPTDVEEYQYQQPSDAEEIGTSTEIMAAGCSTGIERWDSASNSAATFQHALSAGGPWEDPAFKADETSLFWRNALTAQAAKEANQMLGAVVGWKRPGQMGQGWGTSASLWGSLGKPVPGGVSQRSLGDCWFLASAAAVAEESHRITGLTENHSYPANGIFRWKFWAKNAWVSVNVDDRLPVRSYGNGFRPWATSRSSHKAWWMPMLEKAYAKLNQNYQRLAGGFGTVGLRSLTGAPTTDIRHTEGDLWNKLQPLAGKNYAMVAGGCTASSGGLHGLITGHAYSVLDFKELSNGVKLVQVRNPWSQERYTGPWSDSSSLWTPQLKREAGYTDANDGKFFMPADLYFSKFRSTSVALIDNWNHQQVTAKQGARGRYPFHNPSEQRVYINVDIYGPLNSPRTCRRGDNQYARLYTERGQEIGTYDFTT